MFSLVLLLLLSRRGPPLLARPATRVSSLYRSYLVRILSPFLIYATCSSTLHLAHTRPDSAHGSTTRTGTISSTRATYDEADLPPICPYRLLSFLPTNLAHRTSRFLTSFRHITMTLGSTLYYCLRSALALTRIRRQYQWVTLSPSFLTACVHYYLSTAADRTNRIAEHVKHVQNASNSQRKSNPKPSHSPALPRTPLRL